MCMHTRKHAHAYIVPSQTLVVSIYRNPSAVQTTEWLWHLTHVNIITITLWSANVLQHAAKCSTATAEKHSAATKNTADQIIPFPK